MDLSSQPVRHSSLAMMKIYKLLDADQNTIESETPGTLGGNSKFHPPDVRVVACSPSPRLHTNPPAFFSAVSSATTGSTLHRSAT